MALLIRIDGEDHRRPEDAKISVYDHGFLFGDSVYEVFRTFGGYPFDVEAHLERLQRSADRLSLDLQKTHAQLAAEIDDAVRAAGCEGEAYVRLIVTRGVGELSIDPTTCTRPTTIFIVKDLKAWPERFYTDGVDLRLVGTVRNERNTIDPSIKTGNYLNSVIAYIEAKQAGGDEAVMLNAHGQVTESTTSNLFIVQGGGVATPSLESGILSGCTRNTVLRLCREAGIPAREGTLSEAELRGADEAFITSTTRDVMPVGKLDGEPLAGEVPGPVTRRLMELFRAEAEAFVASRRAASERKSGRPA
jgi:branched-chain amino acid aminotransferase